MKTHLNPSSMIRTDHLGKSSIPNLQISYIEGNSCFKFRRVILGYVPLFLKFSNCFNYHVFLMFIFTFFCALVSFIYSRYIFLW